MKPAERLRLIHGIYDYVGRSARPRYRKYSHKKLHTFKLPFPACPANPNRESPIAWDLSQIMAAIAGNYRIQLSPCYKGVQRIRRNAKLWAMVSKFVILKPGYGCLPHDVGTLKSRWEQLQGKATPRLGTGPTQQWLQRKLMKTNELVPPAVKLSRIPMSRNDYLDRRAKLWSLIQGIDPERANLEEIAAEKAALDEYERVESLVRARKS